MLRRNARLRREYLYRKSLEGKEREEYERKRVIRQALEGMDQFSSNCVPKYKASGNIPLLLFSV